MRAFGPRLDGAVVALGNAPTALREVLALAAEGVARPALVIGMPVGFVDAAESKDALMELGPDVRGHRGHARRQPAGGGDGQRAAARRRGRGVTARTRQLRTGLTTGTCAAAAAAAAARALAGELCDAVDVELPDGERVTLAVESVERPREGCARAAVVKDAGDDPDVTDGMTVVVEVEVLEGRPADAPAGRRPPSPARDRVRGRPGRRHRHPGRPAARPRRAGHQPRPARDDRRRRARGPAGRARCA